MTVVCLFGKKAKELVYFTLMNQVERRSTPIHITDGFFKNKGKYLSIIIFPKFLY